MALFSTLSDNFDDNSFDTGIWGRTNSTYVKEQNQRIEMSSAFGLNVIQYFYSLSTYDLTGSYALAKITNYTSIGAGAFDIAVSTGQTLSTSHETLAFSISGNTAFATISARYTTGGVTTTLVSGVTYNSSTHLWFRIRESGGTIYWDTSDGTTWTNFASVATPIVITSLYYFNSTSNIAFLYIRTTGNIDYFNLGDTATTSTSSSSSTSSTSSSTSTSTSTSSTSSSTSNSTSTSLSTSSTSTTTSTSTSTSSTSTSTTQSFTTSTSSTSVSTSSTSASTSVSTSTSTSTTTSTSTSSTSTSQSTSTTVSTSTSTSTSSTSTSTSSTSTSISTSTSTTIAPDLREKGYIKPQADKPRLNIAVNNPKTKHFTMLVHRVGSKSPTPHHTVKRINIAQVNDNKPPKTR